MDDKIKRTGWIQVKITADNYTKYLDGIKALSKFELDLEEPGYFMRIGGKKIKLDPEEEI